MKIEYSKRAVSDLHEIAAYYLRSVHLQGGDRMAARLREVVARIAHAPGSGRPVVEKPGVRVVPLLRYPYLVFYYATPDSVRILHIRHTSRRPWAPR